MFGKLANLFVEIEDNKESDKKEESKATATTSETQPAPQPQQQPATASAPPPTKQIIPATINEEMVEFLSSAIEAANLDGFDYIEFRDSLAAMASAPMSEQQKFIAVFATACTMGLTKEKLLDSISHYQNVIEGKKAEFAAHVEAMVAQEVTAREQLKTRKEQEISALAEQIQKAQASIAEKQQEVVTISNEINEQNLHIQQTASSFEATFGFVAGKLEEDKNKIQSYLA